MIDFPDVYRAIFGELLRKPDMTIDLPQELEERARARVVAGEYCSVEDVVRAGL